jgi:hypothetical protein
MRQLLGVRGGQVDVSWCKRILRDHLEDSFLCGPCFNASLPDFHTICMHESPAGFTWGDTAASAIFVLPSQPQPALHTEDDEHVHSEPAVMHWCAGTPCTGVYLPLTLASRIPPLLGAAGTASSMLDARLRPCPLDAPIDDVPLKAASYWWLCKRFLAATRGNRLGSCFNARQPLARQVLDVVEAEAEAHLSTQRGFGEGNTDEVLVAATRSAICGMFAAVSVQSWATAKEAHAPPCDQGSRASFWPLDEPAACLGGEEAAADAAAVTEFLDTLPDTDVATVFHAVRRLPYGSVGGMRSVAGVLRGGRGSCSGKHMALAALLTRLGHTCTVATLFCDFSAAVSQDKAPAELAAMLSDGLGPVHDFHHVVLLQRDVGTEAASFCTLDATWPDNLAALGFRVNSGWDSSGDTMLAVPDSAVWQRYSGVSPCFVPALKATMVTTLLPTQCARRDEYFRLLSAWLAQCE